MKVKSCLMLTMLNLFVLVACSPENNKPDLSPFTVHTPEETLKLGVEKNSKKEVVFSCLESWKASVNVDWATVAPMTGTAGNQRLKIIAKSFNNVGKVRDGILSLTSKTGSTQLKFSQEMTNVINFEQQVFNVDVKGGELSVKFSSNVRGYKLLFVSQSSNPSWIKPKKDANVGSKNNEENEALEESEYQFTITPNDTHEKRSAAFYIRIVNPKNHNEVYITSGLFNIVQEGLPVETSKDFSRNNTVKQLQKHSKGAGLPIVIMGDGFVDTEINSGRYDAIMNQGMENLFTEEPVKSLREYFDVWQVTLVSQNNAFSSNYKTALDCEIQGNGSSQINGNFDKVMAAIKNIEEMKTGCRLHEVITAVILNTPQYAGTTHFGFSFDGEMSNFAIAYVPLINNDATCESFRSVLCHETLGHGLAKLLDEYAYESNNASIPLSEVNKYSELQKKYGWAQNISFSATNTPWNHILADRRYQAKDFFGEKLGIYEGALGYLHGGWRPTDDSMMFHNRNGFNAPSREAIYKRVMLAAFGTSWKYNFEEFVQFDQAHLPRPTSIQAHSKGQTYMAPFSISGSEPKPLAPPVVYGHQRHQK